MVTGFFCFLYGLGRHRGLGFFDAHLLFHYRLRMKSATVPLLCRVSRIGHVMIAIGNATIFSFQEQPYVKFGLFSLQDYRASKS